MNSAISYRSLSIVYEEPVAEPFKMTIDTTQPGSASDTFVLPLQSTTNNFVIDWGDGNSETVTSVTSVSHTYKSVGGIYQISLDGSFDGIRFNNTGDKLKVLSIDKWGGNEWQTFNGTFAGCSNMIAAYSDTPNSSNVISCNTMFESCTLFNGLVNFDMSNVTATFRMFKQCINFNNDNQPINWTIPNLGDLGQTFSDCTNFNQPVNVVSGPNLSLYQMFYKCTNFNSSVTLSNTSLVTTTTGMFYQCSSFNQPITLDTTSVLTMDFMFYQCSSFNSLITFNDTSQVNRFSYMFKDCTNFNQDISSWSITSLNTFSSSSAVQMLDSTAFSTINYDLLLVAWDSYGTSGSYLTNTPSQYSAGAPATARANMVSRGWTITDGGQV